MHFSLIIPALQAGAKARRKSWEGKQYIYVEGPYSDGSNIHRCSGGSYGTWPSDVRDSGDLLAEDWEILPRNVNEYHSYIPSDVAAAVDVVTAHLKDGDPRDGKNWRHSIREVVSLSMKALETAYSDPAPDARTGFEAVREVATSAVGALSDFMSMHEASPGGLVEALREPKSYSKG